MNNIVSLDSNYIPYGLKTRSNANIIVLGESWAYYMGRYLAEKQYRTITGCHTEQPGGSYWCNYNGTGRPHLDVLEAFDPNLQSDPFNWIPKGLFYDLKDPANETTFPVTDQVSSYTNQQMFNSFQTNINTLQDYRAKLLQTTTNSTSPFVPGLFSQYGY